eukprot:GHRQ01038853.1.p1 GENE.GHRQ01038853.1~~GHRQ01038853.1.p1  ORF type:complete len:148 (+),score=36.24 GHRQ01038853.1:289-732(+)
MFQAFQQLISTFLPSLLLLFWSLATASVIVTISPIPVPQAFKDAVFLASCRGKLWHDKPAALGPLRDWAVPQAWFLHFYIVGSCCNAVVLLMYCLSSSPGSTSTHMPLLALLLMQLHLGRRALETAVLMRYPRGAVMHGIAYVFGIR